MKNHPQTQTTIRSRIALATRDIHDALHKDPVLGKLLEPSVTLDQYQHALGHFLMFYSVVEHQRRLMGIWSEYSLSDDCAALRCDLRAPRLSQESKLRLETPSALLGGLYVACGAAFGRSQFRANVEKALPGARHSFVQRRPDKSLWASLVSDMEKTGAAPAEYDQLFDGANRSFEFMAGLKLEELVIAGQHAP
ncbi:hypothetical protein [uncultured Roseobacter sp.]|uniref:hypothetical protein n=1 Tax=uncultured Roseobacter sp. TaxID=114847 RepID=UPI00261D76C6|nr:hypothetical protein [uncultured Roseobacter sp.]